MTDVSDKKSAPTVTESLGAAASSAPRSRSIRSSPSRSGRPSAVALLVLQLYVWIRWITGPYFQRVPSGPSDPPMYMKVPLMANAVVALGWPAVRASGGSSSGPGAGSGGSPSTACSWCRWA